MEHKKSKVIVYESDDYKRFRFIDGNRETNDRKIDKIIAEIRSGNDILDESPILVTVAGNFLDIKDGQNRFLITKKLERKVHYIIKKEKLSLYNLAKNNSNVERWKDKDYINCYVKAGNENYIQLKDFHEKYGVAIGVCLGLLTHGVQRGDGGSTGNAIRASFEQGNFIVKKRKEAIMLIETCKNFSAFPAWNSRGFILAISKLLDAKQCDFEILMKKFNRDPKKLEVQHNWKGYLVNLELIYNYDNSKRRAIY